MSYFSRKIDTWAGRSSVFTPRKEKGHDPFDDLPELYHTGSGPGNLIRRGTLRRHFVNPEKVAKETFIRQHPVYSETSQLDRIRKEHYERLDKAGQIYLDYTGASLYPAHLVKWHAALLAVGVFGNPHSASPASQLSTVHEVAARRAVLAFLDADPNEYDVIFTANATGAIKLVSDNYPFSDRRLLIMADAHNSINGMARNALNQSGSVDYVDLTSDHSTLNEERLEELLQKGNPGLAFITDQSNITGAKAKTSWYDRARRNGWHIGLDASALAPSTPISLRRQPVDFLAISIYKIIGYPPGVGALVLTKEARRSILSRHTFSGGTIDAIRIPDLSFRLYDSHSAFEDGTINYLSLPAVARGLEFVAPLIPLISRRCQTLIAYLWSELSVIRYDDDECTPLLEMRGPPPGSERGSTLPLLFRQPRSGCNEEFRFVIWAAAQRNISIRGGPCLCNPGSSSSVLRGAGHEDWEKTIDSKVGIIRVSLGIASNFEDCYRFVQFCQQFATLSWYDAERSSWSATL